MSKEFLFKQVGDTVKFSPPTGTDSAWNASKGVIDIKVKFQCITIMKHYENKSIEEIRFEDYSSNRKVPTGGGGRLFGSASQPSSRQVQKQVDLFGQTSTPMIRPATTSIYGATGLFGSQSKESKTTSSLSFGNLLGHATPHQEARTTPQRLDVLKACSSNQTGNFFQPSTKLFETPLGKGGVSTPACDQSENKPVRTASGSTSGTPARVAAPTIPEIEAKETI